LRSSITTPTTTTTSCRRQGRCAGRRAEHDWSFPLRPVIPPCVPLDVEIVEKLRDEIREATDLRDRG
jgi:hypothetical protein